MQTSSRARNIEPFYVMELGKAAAAKAQSLKSDDPKVIFLNIGEPDFTAPTLVREAAILAIEAGKSQYTPATGLMELRERISGWYAHRYKLNIAPERIVITAGASAALQLACLALIEAGDEILMPDPSYPCNRHFVSASEGRAVMLPATPEDRFQLTAEAVRAAWEPRSRGVMLASPSNPTGTSIHPLELRKINDVVRERGGITLVDEIYLPLSFDEQYGQSALGIDDNIISINSFSKYFNMTGWRLGWMVVPESLVGVIEKLAQNLFICPSAISQHAALACFEPESLAVYEERRAQFKARRDFFIPALESIGFRVPVVPDGAFYAWADCSLACEKLGVQDSWDLAFEVLNKAHIAITPGRDFGHNFTKNYVRFSTSSSMQQLLEAVERLGNLLR